MPTRPHVFAWLGQFQTAVHSAKQDLRLELGTRAVVGRTRLMLCNQQLTRRSFAQHVQPDQYRRDDNRGGDRSPLSTQLGVDT